MYSPGPKKQSPWFYVGIGCATIGVVGFAGCITLAVTGFNRFQTLGKEIIKEAEKPVSAQELATSFKEVPFYPKATVNTDKSFRTLRATTRLMKSSHLVDDVQVALLHTPDTAEDVLAFYVKRLGDVGYIASTVKTSVHRQESQSSQEFVKGKTMVLVTAIKPDAESASKRTMITLMRLENARAAFRSTIPGLETSQ